MKPNYPPLTLLEIVEISGLPVSTVFKAFPKTRNDYLKYLQEIIIRQENEIQRITENRDKAYSRHVWCYEGLLENAQALLASYQREYNNLTWVIEHDGPDGEPNNDEVTPLDVQQAKRVPIQEFYTGSLKLLGKRLTGLCPFHQEKGASFIISTDNNRFHCFGCSADGDSIDFIMKTRNIDFISAVKFLRNR